MAARPALLPQADITRIAKAMRAAGVVEWRIEIDRAAEKVSIIAGSAEPEAGANPCDRLLNGQA